MRNYILILLTIALITPVFAEDVYALVNIDRVGHQRLEEVKSVDVIQWWVELDNQLLVAVARKKLAKLSASYECKVLDISVNKKALYFVNRAHSNDLRSIDVDVLASAGRNAVIQGKNGIKPEFHHHHHHGEEQPERVHATVVPFVANTVLARQSENDPQSLRLEPFAANVAAIVDNVDGERWFRDVEKLASFNRYTHGQDIIRARDWLVSQYEQMPGLEVKTVEFRVGSSKAYNVMATLRGTTKPEDIFIIGAHYDSTSQSPNSAAPGAEDNASGSAGVLEMARIFTKFRPEATIIFMNYSGEEQGLHGSTVHAKKVVSSGQKSQIKSILTMDMIGFTNDSDLDCLLETGSSGQHLLDVYARAASQFTTLRTLKSLNPFGSDHVPYLNRGMPAILIIENDWDAYSSYHRTSDVASNVNQELGEQTLRMNVAVIADMTGAK